MPPARTSRAAQREAAERAAAERAVLEDSRSEGSAPGNGASKRRGAAADAGAAASLSGNAVGSGNSGSSGGGGGGGGGGTTTNSNGVHAHEGIDGMDWSDIPLDVLHKYRQAYRVKCPSASPFYNHLILSQGIGKKTPSRVRERVTREALATAVRKNFNAQPINESDVIISFLYTVKHQGMVNELVLKTLFHFLSSKIEKCLKAYFECGDTWLCEMIDKSFRLRFSPSITATSRSG